MTRARRCAMTRARRCTRVIAASAIILMTACASPPLVWHTLVKPGADARSAAAPAAGARAANHVFEFAVPGVPAQVDRAELVVTDAATRQVRVLEGERWLAPLPEEVRAALSRGYARASGAREATGLARAQGVPLLRVRTMLRRLDIGGGQAVVDAEWSLQLAGDAARDAPLCRWSGSKATPGTSPGADASPSVTTGVGAMQDLLATLAAAIAAMGGAWVVDAATPCPAAADAATPRG